MKYSLGFYMVILSVRKYGGPIVNIDLVLKQGLSHQGLDELSGKMIKMFLI
jgi:hypothetical protein